MTNEQLSILFESLASELDALLEGADAQLPEAKRGKLKVHTFRGAPYCNILGLCKNPEHFSEMDSMAFALQPIKSFQDRLANFAERLVQKDK